jgi:acetylornithine deacetylase/succinyl-diaminopimelate desuccinylase-like protein
MEKSPASRRSFGTVWEFRKTPGSIDRAHGAVEYVEIDEVLKAEAFFREFLRRFE